VNRLPPKSLNLSAAVNSAGLVDRINNALPQTQCTRCSYPACLPYAQAIAAGQAEINQCPPGGDAGIHVLAEITGRNYQPLNPVHGIEKPRQLALIDEAQCIGCTLCIAACPVDAIVGGNQRMHTVIAADCTGCELCVAPCPVDCIAMVDIPAADHSKTNANAPAVTWGPADAARARAQFESRQARLDRLAQKPAVTKKASLAEIMERAKARAAKRITSK
jgi:Na+-translocating ferredoxin:NAD+ oxidoreductase subunit B